MNLCSGGLFIRNSDPWVSFSPTGSAFFMTLAFQPDRSDGGLGANAVLVNRSTNAGVSWGPPATLIFDTNGQILNDKNSLTADPTNPAYAYAVWDRLQDFTLPEAAAAAAAAATTPVNMDGVSLARERVRQLKAEAQAIGIPMSCRIASPSASTGASCRRKTQPRSRRSACRHRRRGDTPSSRQDRGQAHPARRAADADPGRGETDRDSLPQASRVMGEPVVARRAPLTDARHYAKAGVPIVLYGAGPRTIEEANAHRADKQLSCNLTRPRKW